MPAESFLSYFLSLFQPTHLFFCVLGAFLGNVVGVLPGLGPPAAMAILLPLTVYIPPVDMLIMMAAIYYGAMYGGTITAVLLNVPGETATVITCIEGFEMTKQGRAAQALSIAAIGSYIAGTLSIIPLQFLSAPIAEFALSFGPPEYTGLLFMSFLTLMGISSKSLSKGITMLFFGMGLSTIGVDPLAGVSRLAIGPLASGFDVIPAVMGLFGLSETLMASGEVQRIFAGKLGRLFPPMPELIKGLKASLRGGVIGFFFGLLPGVSPSLTTFVSYDVERRLSKYPEKFGTGVIEGVAAPEAANNSCIMGGFIPLLSLGIPNTPPLAIFFAALMIYGITPGPLLFQQNPHVVWPLIASMYLANTILLAMNLPIVGVWARIAMVPYKYIVAIVMSLCIVGAYCARNLLWDVWVLIFFAILGCFMKRYQLPPLPLIFGLLLGNKFEQSVRQSLGLSGGDFSIFLSRPICLAFLVTGILILLLPRLFRYFRKGA